MKCDRSYLNTIRYRVIENINSIKELKDIKQIDQFYKIIDELDKSIEEL